MNTEVIRIYSHGGPEKLQYETMELTEPAADQVQIQHQAIGLNYADIYEREGDHGGPQSAQPFPITLGHMAAGTITKVGAHVTTFKKGDRVAYIGGGSYCGSRNMAPERLIHIPDSISHAVAGAYMLRGLTAEYLVQRLWKIKPGDIALIHAAAGGMGILLSQWAKALGATVIGTVSSPEKAEIAKDYGCAETINYTHEDFVKRVMEITNGRGADVIYDGVGKDTFLPSLDCIRPRGMVISYGTASGNVGKFDLQRLHSKSIIVTRPTLRSYISEPGELLQSAKDFFQAVETGTLNTPIAATYPLSDARSAHEALQSRQLMGPAILIPEQE